MQAPCTKFRVIFHLEAIFLLFTNICVIGCLSNIQWGLNYGPKSHNKDCVFLCFTHCSLFSFQSSGYEVYILEAPYKDPAVSIIFVFYDNSFS